jgi:hypothetical protein
MRPIIGAVVVGALAMGGAIVLATSRHSSDAQAYQTNMPIVVASPALVPIPLASPIPTHVVARHDVMISTSKPQVVVTHTRSTKSSVAIIGGSTVGGAIVGGLIGGKKGAVIGGLAAGTAGTIYDHKTRHKTSSQ